MICKVWGCECQHKYNDPKCIECWRSRLNNLKADPLSSRGVPRGVVHEVAPDEGLKRRRVVADGVGIGLEIVDRTPAEESAPVEQGHVPPIQVVLKPIKAGGST